MTFTIRRPGPADAESLALLHVATWQETYAHLLPDDFFGDAHLESRRGMWRRLLADDRAEWMIRLAEDAHEKPIGFAMSGPAMAGEAQDLPREQQLYMVYVAAAHHGSGAGQALLDAVLADRPALLWVAKENPRAIAFYRRNGFEFDGAEQVDPGAPLITDARMVR